VLTDLAATLLGAARTRLDLLVNEVQLEKLNLMRQLRLTLALAFCLAMMVLLLLGLALTLWWEQRLTVLLLALALFGAAAVRLGWALRRPPDAARTGFDDSLDALQEDLRLLREASRGQDPH
jgi:uncharacterized membrane protein YqjE